MKIFLLVVLIFLHLQAQADSACQPCQGVATLPELVAESELIILAYRKDPKQDEQYVRGPDSIEVKVFEVLKSNGEVKVGDHLIVRSWYGECPYGVHMARYANSLLFLKKEKKEQSFFDKITFAEPVYEAATFEKAWCNEAKMRLKGKDLIIWDPILRQRIKYPYELFKQQFLGINPTNAQQ